MMDVDDRRRRWRGLVKVGGNNGIVEVDDRKRWRRRLVEVATRR